MILNCGFHLLSVWFVGRAYYHFRKGGGIHGLASTRDLPEEKLLRKGVELAKKGAEKAEEQLDKEAAKEKTADLEANAVKIAIAESKAIN